MGGMQNSCEPLRDVNEVLLFRNPALTVYVTYSRPYVGTLDPMSQTIVIADQSRGKGFFLPLYAWKSIRCLQGKYSVHSLSFLISVGHILLSVFSNE